MPSPQHNGTSKLNKAAWFADAACCNMLGVNVVKERLLSGFLALAVTVSTGLPVVAADAQATPGAPSTPAPADASAVPLTESPVLEKPVSLTPAALQLAEQLGLSEKIKQLDSWRSGASHNHHGMDVLQTKQAIMLAVLAAMLQVRATSAQIAYDVFEAGQLRTLLEGRRDRAIKYNSIANFVSGGVAEMAGGSLQLVPNLAMDNAGNIVEMVGGAMQTGLSALALRQQAGQKRATPTRPNMLAPIFDQTTDQDSRYPAIVWKYLTATPPEGGDSRRIALIKQWLEYGRLPGRDVALISALSGNGGKRYPVTIDVLEDRQAMLTDVNALVFRIDRLLLEILLYSDVANVN